jgi:hypothetical protein
MVLWIVAGTAALLFFWLARRFTVRVPCTLDLEATHEHFHAHAELDGLAVREGDAVLIHGAPDHIPFGETRRVATTATVRQASWARRLLVRVLGTSGITELYDVGFEG